MPLYGIRWNELHEQVELFVFLLDQGRNQKPCAALVPFCRSGQPGRLLAISIDHERVGKAENSETRRCVHAIHERRPYVREAIAEKLADRGPALLVA